MTWKPYTYWQCIDVLPTEGSGGGMGPSSGGGSGGGINTGGRRRDKAHPADPCLRYFDINPVLEHLKRKTKWIPCEPHAGPGVYCCLSEEDKKKLICLLVETMSAPILSANPGLQKCLMEQWLNSRIGCSRSTNNPRIRSDFPFSFPINRLHGEQMFLPWLQDIFDPSYRQADGSYQDAIIGFSEKQIENHFHFDLLLPLIALCAASRFKGVDSDLLFIDAAILLGRDPYPDFLDCEFLLELHKENYEGYKKSRKGKPGAGITLKDYIEACCAKEPGGLPGDITCAIFETNLFYIDGCGSVWIRQPGMDFSENISDAYLLKGKSLKRWDFVGKDCEFFTNVIHPVDGLEDRGLRFVDDKSASIYG